MNDLPSPETTGLLTRRTILGVGGATLAGLTLAGLTTAGPAAAAATVQTYSLDPTIGGTCASPGCSVCNACTSHAANKLFATVVDAEAGRAHPGCRCTVVPGISVAQIVFDELFANGATADRRTPAIGALLASAPASVVASGLSGWLPAAVAVGGVVTIGVIAARRRLFCDDAVSVHADDRS